MKRKLNITASIPAYISKENSLQEENMQEQFKVGTDEKTGEACFLGHDSKSKMQVTFLFQSSTIIDTEKVITDTLKTSFIERIKKENLK